MFITFVLLKGHWKRYFKPDFLCRVNIEDERAGEGEKEKPQ